MITFKKQNHQLILKYTVVDPFRSWGIHKLLEGKNPYIRNTFNVCPNDLVSALTDNILEEGGVVEFLFAELEGDYFKINREILKISFDLYIFKNFNLLPKYFCTENHLSIFKIVNDLRPITALYIGGSQEGNLPIPEFLNLIKSLPKTYELRKYVTARVSTILREYIDTEKDGQKQFENYLNKKVSPSTQKLSSQFLHQEIIKYQSLLNHLEIMLENWESYSEANWQNEILDILLLLYPKYLKVFKGVKIRDVYNQTNRDLDFMLVDSLGHVDIVEIKKPFQHCVISKSTYRDNYVPVREMAGSVMQIEKYLFYLNKWGRQGEECLTSKFKGQLPDNLNIKITNPSGIIIMGRSLNLDEDQKYDFEIIKRKYKNIIDILTYDDLILRLKISLSFFQKNT